MSPALAPSRSHHRYVPSYRLDELFDDTVLRDKLNIAKYRVLMGFAYATHWQNGRLRGTDNYIVGVGPRQKDLVDHIVSKVTVELGKSIVAVSDLPLGIDGSTSMLRQVARSAERQLIAVCVSVMVADCHIWFEENVPGSWNILQSAMDEYHHGKQTVANAKKIDATLRREKLHGGGRLRMVH